MNNSIRIGTRDSKLALWQAKQVDDFLAAKLNCKTETVLIKTDGDINLTTPLYEVGIQGIFTKALDIALLENKIDLAVHSLKDVPTQLAEGLCIAAVMKRGNPFDVLVCRNEDSLRAVKEGSALTIATSSIRRKAQWLYHSPGTVVKNLRGNIHTRLQKLQQSDWHGAIFAAAGLERLGLEKNSTYHPLLLSWMLPAPGQGAVAVVCRENSPLRTICTELNDTETAVCTGIERDFLRLLQGGCSTPISAFATMRGDEIYFKGNITTVDGRESVSIMVKEKKEDFSLIAEKAVDGIKLKKAGQLLGK